MAVSRRLRFEILRRDNHTCRYCGGTAPEVKLTVDHVIPEALGGTDDPGNLVAACADCNGGKSSVAPDAPLVADVTNDAMRWAVAMRQAADEIAAEEDTLDAIYSAVYQAWQPRWIPSDYRNSVYNLVKAGLTQRDLLDLVDVALSARWVDDRWAYFCGCGWKRIKQRQERARVILDRGLAIEVAEIRAETQWTVGEIRDYELDAIDSARDQLGEDRLRRLLESPNLPQCRHGVARHCGDPVCIVEDSAMLMMLARGLREGSDRDDAVCAEAEFALNG